MINEVDLERLHLASSGAGHFAINYVSCATVCCGAQQWSLATAPSGKYPAIEEFRSVWWPLLGDSGCAAFAVFAPVILTP